MTPPACRSSFGRIVGGDGSGGPVTTGTGRTRLVAVVKRGAPRLGLRLGLRRVRGASVRGGTRLGEWRPLLRRRSRIDRGARFAEWLPLLGGRTRVIRGRAGVGERRPLLGGRSRIVRAGIVGGPP